MGLIDRRYRLPGARRERPSELARLRVDGDLRALERLRASGVDRTRPLALQLAIRLETRKRASEIAAPLRGQGYAVEIEPSGLRDGTFDLIATRAVVASDEAVLAESERFQAIALEAGGDYRGWRLAPDAP
jgi:hypothetical protein